MPVTLIKLHIVIDVIHVSYYRLRYAWPRYFIHLTIEGYTNNYYTCFNFYTTLLMKCF